MSLSQINYVHKLIVRSLEESDKANFNIAWMLMEEAHIFSQPFAGVHFYVHLRMLFLSIRVRNYKEIFGQTVRLLVAVPSSFFRVYPVGNTGRSSLGIFSSLPLSGRIIAKMQQLEKMEVLRIENGGEVKKYVRMHPIVREKLKLKARPR
ncbi:DUF3703 domain-containing protein [Bdellovibrio sp.]|uniref:DUF3703 domain-containing protein n=1 Tax=Bdellovibrio sp. TaxID=28201 RepID=UPI0039E653F4